MRKASLLVLLRQRDDAARQRRREQQRAARLRRGLEDEFQILAKAEIEHLVGLVEHDGLQLRDVEAAAPQMIAQPSRRADDDMRAVGELALLAARVHAADAGDDARAGILIEPGRVRAAPAGPVRASARRSAPAAAPAALEALGVAEQIRRRSPGHRRRSCRSRSAPRPAGRGRRRRRPAPRSAPASGRCNCARPKHGRAADCVGRNVTRCQNLNGLYQPEMLNTASNQTIEAAGRRMRGSHDPNDLNEIGTL